MPSSGASPPRRPSLSVEALFNSFSRSNNTRLRSPRSSVLASNAAASSSPAAELQSRTPSQSSSVRLSTTTPSRGGISEARALMQLCQSSSDSSSDDDGCCASAASVPSRRSPGVDQGARRSPLVPSAASSTRAIVQVRRAVSFSDEAQVLGDSGVGASSTRHDFDDEGSGDADGVDGAGSKSEVQGHERTVQRSRGTTTTASRSSRSNYFGTFESNNRAKADGNGEDDNSNDDESNDSCDEDSWWGAASAEADEIMAANKAREAEARRATRERFGKKKRTKKKNTRAMERSAKSVAPDADGDDTAKKVDTAQSQLQQEHCAMPRKPRQQQQQQQQQPLLEEMSAADVQQEVVVPYEDPWEAANHARASGEEWTWPQLPAHLQDRFDDSRGMLNLPVDADGVFGRMQVSRRVHGFLHSFQVEGVKFMAQRIAAGGGCILNHDMGLGKTVQIAALLSAAFSKTGLRSVDERGLDRRHELAKHLMQRRRQMQSKNGILAPMLSNEARAALERREIQLRRIAVCGGPGGKGTEPRCMTLIVTVSSVVGQFVGELHRWGCFDVVQWPKTGDQVTALMERCVCKYHEVMVCGYETVRRHAKLLGAVDWDLVVFDEVHFLKNPEAMRTEAARSLRCLRRIGLTGTLMPNNVVELYHIVNIVCGRHVFGPFSHYKSRFEEPITVGQTKGASEQQRRLLRYRSAELRQLLKGVLHRRKKEDVIAHMLPKKSDEVVLAPMTPIQARVYQRVLASPGVRLLRMYDPDKGMQAPCDCGKGEPFDRCCMEEMLRELKSCPLWRTYHEASIPCAGCSGPKGMPFCLIFPAMSYLTKAANHIELIKPDQASANGYRLACHQAFVRKCLADDAAQVGGFERCSQFETVTNPANCGKLQVLGALLDLWGRSESQGADAGGDGMRNKVLIFSNSLITLDILSQFLARRGLGGAAVMRLDGQTPMAARQDFVKLFNTDESAFVFLISTKAGGTGLNLTGANIVVIFDPEWNPANDLQAQDRAFRIGQTRDVRVYRLLSLGTIQEVVYLRQVYKTQISNVVLNASKEPRHFDAVLGTGRGAGIKGELFGAINLFKYSPRGFSSEIRATTGSEPCGRQRRELGCAVIMGDGRADDGVDLGAVVTELNAAGGSGPAGGSGGAPDDAPKPPRFCLIDDIVDGADDEPEDDGGGGGGDEGHARKDDEEERGILHEHADSAFFNANLFGRERDFLTQAPVGDFDDDLDGCGGCSVVSSEAVLASASPCAVASEDSTATTSRGAGGNSTTKPTAAPRGGGASATMTPAAKSAMMAQRAKAKGEEDLRRRSAAIRAVMQGNYVGLPLDMEREQQDHDEQQRRCAHKRRRLVNGRPGGGRLRVERA